MREIRLGEARFVSHHQEIRGHSEHMGYTQYLVGQQFQEILWIKFPQHHVGAAGMERGVGINVQPAGMKSR